MQYEDYFRLATFSSYFSEITYPVNELVMDATLEKGIGNSLIVKIINASNSFVQGNTNATVNQLNAFINEVNDLINSGLLTVVNGIEFITLAEEAALLTHGSYIDPRDGNIYYWKKIGDQIWTTQNLRTTVYNDGTEIPTPIDLNSNGSTNDEWMALTTPAYCWYNNNSGNRYPFGALYNVYAVNTGKLCPTGWHVPSQSEWTTLLRYLDPVGNDEINTAGGSIKSTGYIEDGTGLWYYPNTGATNASGFTGIPSGIRSNDANGRFVHKHRMAYFWSSTKILPNGGNYFRRLHHDQPILSTNTVNPNTTAMSIRCVKDN